MRWAVCRAHAVALARDHGALAMTFVLPVLVFLVFSAIFAGATGDELRVSVTIVDEADSPLSRRLAAAVATEAGVRVAAASPTRSEALARVARGDADVAVVFRRDGRPLDTLAGDGAAPVLVLSHVTRTVAGRVVAGAVQQAYFSALPDAALRGAVSLVDELVVTLTPEQRRDADETLDALAADAARDSAPAPDGAFSSLVESGVASDGAAPLSLAAYYAAAVTALFVLLAAAPGAAGFHDVLRSGIADRVCAGPAGLGVLVDGRAAYLAAQGVVQSLVIFATAWLRAGAVPWDALPGWALVTLAVAVAAAGLVLLIAAACRTTRQATTVANIVVLVLAAVGGSMVPRFLMPAWLQQLGWLTPNAWAIHGFDAAGRGPDGWPAVAAAALVLFVTGGVAWAIARRLFVARAVV